MSDTAITLSVVLSILIVCMFILDIKFAVPFAHKMAEVYRERKEADFNTVINHIAFITLDVIMIVAYLMLGHSNPYRIVLTTAGLGVGASIFTLGFQIFIVAKGYRDRKLRVSNTTAVTEQTVVSSEEPKVGEEPKVSEVPKVGEESSTETIKGTDAEVESTNKKESDGTEPITESDKTNDTSSEDTQR